MKLPLLGTLHVCLLYFIYSEIFLHECEASSTIYGRQGQSVTLFWNQTQGYRDFKVQIKDNTLITVSNYNTVTVSNYRKEGPPQFTGNLSSSGVGMFRFVLSDLQLADDGKYRCFRNGPGRTWIPDCGVDLVVIQIQTHFMVVPDTVAPDRNRVHLSCYTSILPQHLHPQVLFTWRKNDAVLAGGERYGMVEDMKVWNAWKYFHSRLTITRVEKKDCWSRYSCRVEFEGQIMSNWSKEYTLGEDYSNPEDNDVTFALEGTNPVMIFKMPLLESDVKINSPAGETVIQVNPSHIYAWRSVTVRLTIVEVIASSSSTTARVVLNNVTSVDVGMYYCDKTDGSRITGRRLELLKTEVPRARKHGNKTCSLERAPTPLQPAVAADGCVISALAFVGCLVAAMVYSL